MLNTLLLNTQTLNSAGTASVEGADVKLSFNGYSFQEANVITNRLSRDSGPNRDLNYQRIPRSNGVVLLSDYYTQRLVRIKGIMSADTRVQLDQDLKEMKNAIAKQNGTLIIPDETNQLVTTATWSNSDSSFYRDDHYFNTFCEYDLAFLTTENPFLLEPSFSSEAFFNQTLLTFSEDVLTTGNAEMLPSFIFLFSSVTDVDHIKITNNTTNESVEADVAISNGSIVEFNTQTLEITVNTVAVDYDGFPVSLINGFNSFTIEMTKNGGGGSPAANYDLTVKWQNAFI